MNMNEFKVHLRGNKSRDYREVQEFAKLMDVSSVLVKTLKVTVDSIVSLQALEKLLELPLLSLLETLTLEQGFSVGATCLDTLTQVVEAGHIPSLVSLEVIYRQDSWLSGGGAAAVLSTISQASSTFSQSWSSSRNGGFNSQSFNTSFSTSQSLPSISSETSRSALVSSGSWKGFASLARVIVNGWLPQFSLLQLNANFRCVDLGDEGAEGLAKLIETGKMTSVKELNLETSSISRGGFEALGQALLMGHLPKLTVLNLSGNSFPPASEDPNFGMMRLIIALEGNRLPALERIGLLGAGQQSTSTGMTSLYGNSIAEAIVEVYTRNTALTAKVDIDWPERALEVRWNLALDRNVKLTELLKRLSADGEDVPVRNAKIFICGFPSVGKTTLRKSLKRSRLRAFICNERKLHKEVPTRGIEVSHIKGRVRRTEAKGTLRLTLWDLAGQEEFHVLHSSFLPDLGMANGKATTFVVVLKAKFNRTRDQPSAKDELTYWLRFIASNSIAGVKRNVVVALNTLDGRPCNEKPQWCELLKQLHVIFEDILKIEKEPMVLDARLLRSVKKLRRSLFEQTGSVLQDLRWPKVCQYIQSNLQSWAKENQNFPVIHWDDFIGKMAASRIATHQLEAAVELLHETGDLIYFRKGSLGEGENPETKLIVLNPQWFCKRIVGELLLPDHMVREGERPLRNSVAPDGTLELQAITVYFNELLKKSPQVNYVVGMLIRLGLCYKVGDDKVLIPSFVENEELPVSLWEKTSTGQFTGRWVMGRSLGLMDTDRNALPKSIFRRLQVQLAQESELGGHPNSDYTVGKSFLAFKKSGMLIWVECDVEETDPRDDRVDVLCKPLLNLGREPGKYRKQQIELVEVVMERLLNLCYQWCPGLKFVQKIILPWSDSEGVKPMLERNTKFSLNDVRAMVQRNGLGVVSGDSDLNWTVNSKVVREVELLSSNDIDELEKKMANRLDAKKFQQLVEEFGLCPETSAEEESAGSTEDFSDLKKSKRWRRRGNNRPNAGFKGHILQEIRMTIVEEGQKTRQHVDQRINEVVQIAEEVATKFTETFEMQRLILQKVQNLESLTWQQMEVMVPRFMYLVDKSGSWLSLQRALPLKKAQLHLLCEARYNDRSLHPVDGQRGVEISKLNDWASSIAPLLENSIKVAMVAAQIVGGMLVPGLQLMFPGFENKEADSLSTMLAQELMTSDAEGSNTTAGSRRCTAVELNESARYTLKNLLGEPLQTKVSEKFGLKRVMLDEFATPKMAWICASFPKINHGASKLRLSASKESVLTEVTVESVQETQEKRVSNSNSFVCFPGLFT
ncbi:hypothetical protein R1sor_025261 [Riccia sorocarpa]|uniref:C-terminal of Roc (COR) domain-containing protein n=1 Tax=Riccia sorocarpa TaxID=122646 RepID=A0ABD3G854_9MARC